jgi:hypothetical protein
MEPVRTGLYGTARGTVAARSRVAWHIVPGGDGALTSGPGTEREKLTVGSRVTDNSRIKNTPEMKIAQKIPTG